MRSLVVALSLFLFFAVSYSASAYYYDDSVVIEIGDGVPSETSITPSSGGLPPGSGSGSGAGGTETGGTSTQGGTGVGAQGSSAGGTTSGGSSSGSVGSTSAGGATADGSGGLIDSLFNLLVTEGAITGGGTQSASTAGQNTSNSSANSNAGTGGGANGDASNASGGGETTIRAAKLRSALRGKDSIRDVLEDYISGYRAGKYRVLSARDVGLMAASAVLEDTNIDELTFGATKFEMVYRSRGYLLGFIPKTFPVHIAVNPQASVATDRVVLTLPWYRFFLRKLFSISDLAREINAVVIADTRIDNDTSSDVQVRLFEAVSLVLKKKAGSVGINQ